MDTHDFLTRTLGTEGQYCLFSARRSDNRRKQQFYPSVAALLHAADTLDAAGYDVYFALATFTTDQSRTADNVHQLRSLFLDLDCGPEKDFPDKHTALNSLRDFCRRLMLPRPILVDSGNGIHVYWNLAQPAPRDVWLRVASKLKQVCAAHNFPADPAVTADAARVLRVPGTHNHKNTPPSDVLVVAGIGEPEPVELAKFAALLGENDLTPLPASKVPTELSAVGDILAGNREHRFSTIVKRTVQGNGCAQIAHILMEPHTITEPLWRAGLSIAVHCSDGDKSIHKLSQGHPDYEYDTTEEKARRIKGPYLCTRFDEYNPDVCPHCPFWGKIKSPIVLGKELRIAAPVSDTEEAVVEVQALPNVVEGEASSHATPAPAPKQYTIPRFPTSYVRGANGGVYRMEADEDGNSVEQVIYHHDIYVTRRVYDKDHGDSFVVRLHLPHDGVREFTIPQGVLCAPTELNKLLAAQGVTVKGPKAWARLGEYMADWVNELQGRASAEVAHTQFGWTEDLSTFLLGNREYSATGVTYNPPTPPTAKFMPDLNGKGTVEEWTELMELYNQPGMELYQLVVGFSFGSPLMALTPHHGFVMHLDGSTGYGKTTAQLAAMSVWGSPASLILNDNDTANSKMNRLEVYKNLFAAFDEMTNTAPKALSDMAYEITSGRQRNRLAASANQERTRGAPWALLVVSSGNMSWHARMEAYKATPDAEKERVFEVRLADYRPAGVKADTEEFLHKITHSCYGTAGDVYAKYLVANREAVRALLLKVQKRLDTAAALDNTNRFKSAGFSSAITGLIIAKSLGLVNYDPHAVFDYVVRLLKDDVIRKLTGRRSWGEIVQDYVAENYTNILSIKSTQDLRAKPEPGVDELLIPDASPRMQLIARYETDLGRLYLRTSPLKLWCTKQQINYQSLVEGLSKEYNVTTSKVRMAKGTKFGKLDAVWALVIDMKLESEDGDDASTATAAQ